MGQLPPRGRERRHLTQAKMRKQRMKDGLCLQCGVKTPINKITKRPYRLCGLPYWDYNYRRCISTPGVYTDGNGVQHVQRNCRGGNNAAFMRMWERKKEQKTE